MIKMTSPRLSGSAASRSSRRLARLRTAGAVLVAALALQGCEAKLAEFFAPVEGGQDLPTPGAINGTVTSSGSPLADIVVDLSGLPSTITDVNGAYSFPAVDPGTYTIGFSGFEEFVLCPFTSFEVDVADGATVDADLDCEDTGGIQGTVTLNGSPWEGIDVLAYNVSDDRTFFGTVGASGQYSIEDVPVGPYVVGTTGRPDEVTCTPESPTFDLEPGQIAQADFVCTSPPRADDVAGSTDVDLDLTASTCPGDVLGPFTAPATFATMDIGGVIEMTVDFADNPAPNIGEYDLSTGVFMGVMDWVQVVPGVEVMETIMLTFTFDAMWNVNYAGTSMVDFRDEATQVAICDRELNLSGTI